MKKNIDKNNISFFLGWKSIALVDKVTILCGILALLSPVIMIPVLSYKVDDINNEIDKANKKIEENLKETQKINMNFIELNSYLKGKGIIEETKNEAKKNN